MKEEMNQQRKQDIWDEIMINPTYSRNVNRNKLQNNNMENMIKRLTDIGNEYLKEYKEKDKCSDYEKGVIEGVYEILDSIKNQLIIDNNKVDEEFSLLLENLENEVK